MVDISREIDDSFPRPGGNFYRLMIHEVPRKGATIQLDIPTPESLRRKSFNYDENEILNLSIPGVQRLCESKDGCACENRKALIFLSRVQIEHLLDEMNSENDTLDIIFLIELHHSVQLFCGPRLFPIRGRKDLLQSYISHSGKSIDGKYCFPRAIKLDSSKLDANILSIQT
jgi:hypothetical protein